VNLENLYYQVRLLNIGIMFLMLGMFLWSMSKSQDFEKQAYQMGDIALGQNLTESNHGAVKIFSVVPTVCCAMLLVSIVGLR
jgi:hypothetical protein